MDKHGLQYRCRFNSNSKADESGKILRNYIKKDFLGDSNIRLYREFIFNLPISKPTPDTSTRVILSDILALNISAKCFLKNHSF